MFFCDPETRLSIHLMDGRWKVAVGVHPRKVLQCSDSHVGADSDVAGLQPAG